MVETGRLVAAMAEDAMAAEDVAVFRRALLRRVAGFIGAESGSLIPHPQAVHGRSQAAAWLDVEERFYTRFVDNRVRYWRVLHRAARLLATDGVLSDADVYSSRERERLEPYVDALIPAGITSTLCATLGFPRRGIAVLCLNRHARATKFTRRQAARLRSIAPLLGLIDAAVLSYCTEHSAENGLQVLSPRERQVGALIHDGLQNKEIATLLGTSVETVRKQARAIYDKLQVEGRVQLVTRFGAALGSR